MIRSRLSSTGSKIAVSAALKSQFLIQLSGAALSAVAFFALTPVLVSALGLQRYGVLLLILSFLIYAGLAEFGLGGATSRQIAACQPEERSRVFGNSLLLSCGLAIIGGVVFALLSLSSVVSVFVDDPAIVGELGRSGVALFSLGAVSIVASIPRGVLFGLSAFISLNLVNLLGAVGGLIAPAFYASVIGTDLSGLIASIALVHSLTLIVGFAACIRLRTTPQFQYDRSTVSTLLSYGAWSTSSAILHRLTNSLDRIAISAFAGPSAVAIFAIPQGALNRSQIFSSALLSAAFPRLAQTSNDERLIDTCYRSLFLMSPLFVIGFALIQPLLEIWLGEEFARLAHLTAVLLAVATWFEILSHVPYTQLQARSALREETKIAGLISIPNLLLLLAAIPLVGVAGAAAVAAARSTAYLVFRMRATETVHRMAGILWQSVAVLFAALASLLHGEGGSVFLAAGIWLPALALSIGLNVRNGVQLTRAFVPNSGTAWFRS